jgi:putative RNA 2'-phosphotransferase
MNLKAVSRELVKALRHDPSILNVKPDSNGWVSVELVLNHYSISMDQLTSIVVPADPTDKCRLAFNEDATKVRANQGHSIQVDLGLTPITPPHKLYHGTNHGAIGNILRSGIKKMNRHHVHMAGDLDTANSVGMRNGTPILLEINAIQMHWDGIEIYKSANGVYLADFVPAKYVKIFKKK